MKKKITRLLALAFPVQLLVMTLIPKQSNWIEQHYSTGIFPKISSYFHFLLGSIPFSMGDLLYLIVGIAIIRWIYLRFKTKFKNPKTWSVQALAFLSIAYFLFYFCWGLNYYRLPLHENLGLESDYDTEDLVGLTEKLVIKTNEIQEEITGDPEEPVTYHDNFQTLKQKTYKGFDYDYFIDNNLKFSFNNVKPSIISLPLTYMGFSGYLNPWTNEAQVNSKLPTFRLPSVMAHEMGHQLGYAKENEANFMAALATLHHADPYIQYSGFTFALQYALGDLRRSDPEKAQELTAALHPGVLKNYEEAQQFWEQYENPLEPFFKLFYGNYLKVNNQPDGMKSYNYVVALLVNYYKETDSL